MRQLIGMPLFIVVQERRLTNNEEQKKLSWKEDDVCIISPCNGTAPWKCALKYKSGSCVL